MGQSLQKLAPAGGEEKKSKELIGRTVESYYKKHFGTNKAWKSDDFYHAVCETIEQINKEINSTQFRIPEKETLEQAFKEHYKGRQLEKEDFQKILQEMIIKTGFSGFGVKDILMYIFGVPVTTLVVKQQVLPKAIPNEIFIPAVTSVTVFVLAKLNKI